ncbi:MAG: c-type cytochrome, partial [Planctomycetes bacterium]|nr:c-type cytochrome [Planctomycetota bacterium]
VRFVDLFTPSLELYRTSNVPLTINGVHLNEHGDKLVSSAAEQALFPSGPAVQRGAAQLERLRQAVLDKSFYWFHRYRTTDGYSIFGGRADLKFVNDQTNREVMQREMEVLDTMTANRDRRIWAVAQDGDLQVDDGNTPPFIEVITNKPGPPPGGKHIYLGGEEAIGRMTVAKGMQVNLFASEEMFPELINPVQMSFDTQGRMWVAAWESYPHWKPKEAMNDKLLILEDTDGDGRADRCSTFADQLHNPTGFEFWGGGVLVAMAPYLLFLQDTDGDGRADTRERVLGGLDSADTHHTANSFTLDPGGALYFQEGTFHHTQAETPWGPPVRCANAGVFRYEPRSQKFDVYVSYGFANPHGHVFDRWGQDIVVDGTGAVPYHGAVFSGHVDFPQKHSRNPPTVYQPRTRPCPGVEILSSRHFPDEMQGTLLVGNVIGFQGILQYKLADQDSSFTAVEMEPILSSSDPSFRPADFEVGPDGAIYFTDWQNPVIGHMQHNLRDPSRDRLHGRVYRVTYEGRSLLKDPKIAGEPAGKLLDLLKQPENRVRYRTRIELSGRDSREVVAAVDRWIAELNQQDADYEHHLLEALWVYQHHNVVNTELLERMLASPDFRARAAATRVLCYWRDRVAAPIELLKRMAADSHPRVRLEAVRAASFLTAPEAVEIAEIAAEQPADRYLDYVRSETLRTLEPYWKDAFAENRPINFTTDAGARFLVRNVSTDRLLTMDRNEIVYRELLTRPGLQDEARSEAVRGLAKLLNRSELQVVIDAIRSLDELQQNPDVSVVFDLVRQITTRGAMELAPARAELEKLATSARQGVFRQIGLVSLINVDGSADNAWRVATRSVGSLVDFVNALPMISDPAVRAGLYPRIAPLLDGLPEPLASSVGDTSGTYGRVVRIELPRRGTLTLAEVEVYSQERNMARAGKPSQKNTSSGGIAERAIDGNTSGRFEDGGQTHTEEDTNNPYWEVDLGREMPIDRVVVYNRTERRYGRRLSDFTLKVLDQNRGVVYSKERNPAPEQKAEFELSGGGPVATVRRAAMTALTHVRGQEAQTFGALAQFVRKDVDRLAAIRALQRIPRATWPKEEAQPLLDVLIPSIQAIPAAERTSPEGLDSLEFASALATLLPPDRAKQVRGQLDELGVRVIRVGTLFERMSYDQDVIVVKAGKPVEFIFENSDLMPHNFVITRPGALEEVGLLGEATAQQPDAARRQYVPASDAILLASNLLQPRELQKLSFNAPTHPGVYPYVCTYPGHWRRMYGALYVVEDMDAYLENAESYLASHPLEIRDGLLKDRRPRTEWKLDDLAVAVADMKQGRSYATGKQMFQVATCVACHKLDGVGNQFGPDLATLDPKLTTLDILKEMLEPSAKINEKFQSQVFELTSGLVVTGIVLEETPESIRVIENPLAKTEPITLRRSEIASQQKAPISMMPKGLLDKLNREEVLDLIAYITARGNKDHELFRSEQHQHHGNH